MKACTPQEGRGEEISPMKKTAQLCRIVNLCFQIDAGLLIEDVAAVAGEGEVDSCAHAQCGNFRTGHVHGGNDHNHILAQSGDVQVDGGTHQLVNVDLGADATLFQGDVLGTDTQGDRLGFDLILCQPLLLIFGQLYRNAANLNNILLAVLYQLGVEEDI